MLLLKLSFEYPIDELVICVDGSIYPVILLN